MREGSPGFSMAEENHTDGEQRRRSPRFGLTNAPLQSENKMALGVKRSIAVRKIVPRKTAVPSEHDKENTPRRSPRTRENSLKISTPGPGSDRRTSASSGEKKRRQPAMPSPILPSSTPGPSQPQLPSVAPEDSVWTQKVRRSYSRLSDRSLHSPDQKDTLFGFEKLKTPEVIRRIERPGAPLEVSGSFTSLLEPDEGCTEPDPNIPGVAVVKEKRRRRKVQQIDTAELEALAAVMNEEFREAEEFELVVE